MKNKNGTAIFLGVIVFFLIFAYKVVLHFISDIQHEIDSGMYTGQAVKTLFLAQGSAVCIFVSVALMLAGVIYFIYLYFLLTEI